MMQKKTTLALLVIAILIFAYIVIFEIKDLPKNDLKVSRLVIEKLEPNQARAVQIVLTNSLIIRAEKISDKWMLTSPIRYKADETKILALISALSNLKIHSRITPADLPQSTNKLDDFGLTRPWAIVSVETPTQQFNISLGAKTLTGDLGYFQVAGQADLIVADCSVFSLVPIQADDWRNNQMVDLAPDAFNKIEFIAPSPLGFSIEKDEITKSWQLTKPTPARADNEKIQVLINVLRTWKIAGFVSYKPSENLEMFGLSKPQYELVFLDKTNQLAKIQIGLSPSNNATLVYARLSESSNIVLAYKDVLEKLLLPPIELRDRHLVSAPVRFADTIEIRFLTNTFSIERQNSNVWFINLPQKQNAYPAEPRLVNSFLEFLEKMEFVGFGKDVVTDFSSYDLDPPIAQYTLKQQVATQTGTATNIIIASIQLGKNEDDKVVVRRDNENSVNYVRLQDCKKLPSSPIQLRNLSVWNFDTNDIVRITVQLQNQIINISRSGSKWFLGTNALPVSDIIAAELDELLYRFSSLKAESWVDLGDAVLQSYGFNEANHRIAISLSNSAGSAPKDLVLIFGKFSPSLNPYACITIENVPWVFEFPKQLFSLYLDLLNKLSSNHAQ